MKTYLAPAMILLAFAGPALATGMDADGDGMVTLTEAQAVMPDMTAETFAALDVNADGALDTDEVSAAQAAGIVPKG